VLGKISLIKRLNVVFPLDEQPLTPTTIAFRVFGIFVVAGWMEVGVVSGQKWALKAWLA
jgi:hypothetical protein